MLPMGKKSYKGFIISLLTFLMLMVGIILIPAEDESLFMRLVMLLVAWYMAGLSFHIWRTEQVYWYNGTTFEEAEAAGSERRKAFAWRHFRIFGMFALLMTLLSCGMQLLGVSGWIDFAVGMVGLIVAACRTISFKL